MNNLPQWLEKRMFYYEYKLRHTIPNVKTIEVTGPPGVGKSSFVDMLVKRGVVERSRIFRPFLWVYEMTMRTNPEVLSLEEVLRKEKRYDAKIASKKWMIMRDPIFKKGKGTWLFDEYFCHHFPKVIMEELSSGSRGSLILQNRMVVILATEPAQIAENIKKRFDKTRKILPIHRGKSRVELEKESSRSLAWRKDLLRLLQKHGIPCLEVDLSTGLSHAVDEFVADLSAYYNRM